MPNLNGDSGETKEHIVGRIFLSCEELGPNMLLPN